MEDFARTANTGKFADPFVTAKGEARASVALTKPETLWFNTGTLCNITCANCYIESSPTNDALVYLTRAEVEPYLDEIETLGWPIHEIAFTGGEPFMNPEMAGMMEAALERGFQVLVLTNAMRPMMRKSVQKALLDLAERFRDKMTFRISVDHWSEELHNAERGKDAFARTLEGMAWLRDAGFPMAVAGRIAFHESEADARAGYGRLYQENNFNIDAQSPGQTVLFPEMDMSVEVPEITTDCWGILNKSPEDVMCASSRMVVKRKGATAPAVLACTLLAYAPEFELGTTLADASGPVQLNHPHCAKFCVLGGASCSA